MTQTQITIITILLIFSTNLIGFLYSYIILYTNIFKSLRIQDKKYKPDILWKRIPLVVFNICTLMALASIGIYMMDGWFGTELPSVFVFTIQLGFIYLIDDLFFYFMHRWLHTNKFMMQSVHRIHHNATTPFPLEYIYVHPFEWMLGFLGPMIAIIMMLGVNVYVFWIYLIFRNLHELDIHSGIKTILFRYFPFWGTVEHHDKHHEKLNGNYSSTFTYLDKLFRTEIKK